VAAELLASKSKTDVLESMNFFVTAYRFQICNSNIGIKKMIHLVWSKDSGDKETTSIKEHLIQSFLKIYIDINAENEDDRTTQIVQNLVKYVSVV
jgi:condensin complex subunit 1